MGVLFLWGALGEVVVGVVLFAMLFGAQSYCNPEGSRRVIEVDSPRSDACDTGGGPLVFVALVIVPAAMVLARATASSSKRTAVFAVVAALAAALILVIRFQLIKAASPVSP